ncbi:hypothetical protein [Novosphingobium jiangmenense]|uniref:Tetratricopeptide repeat protein n=1 Tax=Novosphingobium jiangmenense TaxID=2791981 RepID=A0ABS0HIS0_9SPHN|nr:hypothetical protein [Novosphingobium jiangmenense]MBF9152148.1 hypothetical protein [Novosphingobium jiangmenense]
MLVVVCCFSLIAANVFNGFIVFQRPATSLAPERQEGSHQGPVRSSRPATGHKASTMISPMTLPSASLIASMLDPTNPIPVRQAADALLAQGRIGQGEALYGLASRLSRRDLVTNVHMLEQAARAGDAEAALTFYDAALRTTPAAGPILMPSLARGFGREELIPALAGLMSKDPPWIFQFIDWMRQNQPQEVGLSRVLIAAPGSRASQNAGIRGVVEASLVHEGRIGEAARLHAAFNRQWKRNGADLTFISATSPSPFEWQVMDNNTDTQGFGAEIDSAKLKYWLHGSGGLVAQKLLVLSAGNYRLTAEQDAAEARITAILRCFADKRVIGMLELTESRQGFELIIPETCNAQWLDIQIAPLANADERGNGTIALEMIRQQDDK